MEPLLVCGGLYTTNKADATQSQAAREILKSGLVPSDFCPEINVVSFPQIGYLVVCKPYDSEGRWPLGWEVKVSCEINSKMK